jgi:hypothetical protein
MIDHTLGDCGRKTPNERHPGEKTERVGEEGTQREPEDQVDAEPGGDAMIYVSLQDQPQSR